MKLKRLRSAYKIEFAILISALCLFFISEYSTRYTVAIITQGVILFGTIIYYGFKKDNEYFRWTATRIVIAILVGIYILDLIVGLYLGYNSTLFLLSFNHIFNGVLPIIIITIITEYLRFIIVKNNFTNKNVIYIITALMMVFSFTINYPITAVQNIDNYFIFITKVIIPLIAIELLTANMTNNYGFIPSVVYKLIMNTYIYMIPITANIGDYLYSVVHLLIPYVIYQNLDKNIRSKTEKKYRPKPVSEAKQFVMFSFTCMLVATVVLVSGLTDFQLIAIATDSMSPTYNRGDAVVLEKMDVKDIALGDILVFKQNDAVVTHRVVNIKSDLNNIYFYTKGDANSSADVNPVRQEDVIGVVRNIVKYVGYPTIKINELIEGGSIS